MGVRRASIAGIASADDSMTTSVSDIVIWRNLSIGSPDAETDKDLLLECFVDTGSLDLLRDTSNPASIVVGRTGHGKSALLIQLAQLEKHAIQVNLFEIAFKYVENSTILKFFAEAGVNLGIFYRLLWRHVLVTELLRERLGIGDQSGVQRWLDSLYTKVRPESPRGKAISYLRQWGEKFWEDTEVRLKEVTEKIESALKTSLSGTSLWAKLSLGSLASLSEQERKEIHTRGSAVVSGVQIKELSQVVELLNDIVFSDQQKNYYVLIDSLDEEWVGSTIRFRLIRALIEEIKTFRKIKRAKIICAVRRDLLEEVYEATRDGGFQEEKYESLYAYLTWSKDDLIKLIDSRVSEVFRRKYTNRTVRVNDILPKARGERQPLDYMFDRTFLRPRDVISYFTECLRVAADRPRISWQVIFEAEITYSRKRLSSLFHEWILMFPSLPHAADVLKGMPASFTRSAISKEKLDDLAMQLEVLKERDRLCEVFRSAYSDSKSQYSEADLVCALLQDLFHVGLIGIKTGEEAPFAWSSYDRPTASWGEIKRTTHIKIHKMFWRALDVRTDASMLYKGTPGFQE